MKKILFFILFVVLAATANAQVISPNPAVAVFVTGAYVAWTTTTAGNSRVDYGTTTAYGSNVSNASSVTFHALTITGLTANTLYHYKVTTGSTVSGDFTFTTLANPTGTVKTVGPSGKDYTTVSACATAAQPGWTCLVYAGSYGAATPASGTSGGGYVTLLAQEAASLGTVTVTGKSYVAIKGFAMTGSVTSGSGSSNNIIVNNNYFNGVGTAIAQSVNSSSVASYWTVSKNIHYNGSWFATLSGNNNLFDDNDMSKLVKDCFYDGALTRSVIRNNKCHDFGPEGGAEHVDFFQTDGNNGDQPNSLSYVLFEGNTVLRNGATGGNGDEHYFISRDPSNSPANIIFRYEFVQNVTAGCLFGTNENILSNRLYNNTFALESKAEDNAFSSYYANYTKSLNNLAYNTCGTSQNCFDTGTGIVNNYNVQRDSVNTSASWGSDYQDEATYATLKNLDPGFTNYPYEKTIASNSALIDKGGNLTTVTSGCGTATLTLADVRWFQPGWAGTNADTLKIGATVAGAVEALITGINYSGTAATSSGTVTFGSAVSCTNGDKVWLYKNSSGTIVLAGTAPDIGAYEYGVTAGAAPSVPTSLGVTLMGVKTY